LKYEIKFSNLQANLLESLDHTYKVLTIPKFGYTSLEKLVKKPGN